MRGQGGRDRRGPPATRGSQSLMRPERSTAQAQPAHSRAKRPAPPASGLDAGGAGPAASLHLSAAEGRDGMDYSKQIRKSKRNPARHLHVQEPPLSVVREASGELHTPDSAAPWNAVAVAPSPRTRKSSAPLASDPEPHEARQRASRDATLGAAEVQTHDALLAVTRLHRWTPGQQAQERRHSQKMQSFLTESSGPSGQERMKRRTASSGSNFYAHVINQRQ